MKRKKKKYTAAHQIEASARTQDQTIKMQGTKSKVCFAGIIGIKREAWRARD
ncbi:hypothetical protein Hanom_Chr11g01053581 [Helianthus anomalus]